MFKDCLLLYLISIRTKEFINNRPEGDNFIIIDDYFYINNQQPFALNPNTRFLNVLFTNTFDVGNPYTMIQVINKINYLANYNVMRDLLWYAYFNEYNNFFKKILSFHFYYDMSERWFYSDEDWDRQYSLINGTMFVVNDLDLFI